MIWEFMEVISAIVNTILILLFLQAFLERERGTYAAVRIFVVLAAISAKFFINYFFSESIVIFSSVSVLAAFFIGLVFFHYKIYITAIAAFFTWLAGAISELAAAFIVTSFQDIPIGDATQFNIYRLQIRTLGTLFLLIIIILIRRFRKSQMGAMTTKVMLSLFVMPIVSALAVQQFVVHLADSSYPPNINEILLLFSIATINVFIFILVEIIMRQSEKSQKLILIEAQNEAHQTHIKQLVQNQRLIRTMSHDFRQQVHELYALCIENNFDELKSKLLELSNRQSETLLVDTKNIMLDSILTSKFEAIQNHEIDFKRKIDIQPELDYIDSRICILLGNALDNAIEACMRSKGDKFIGMELIATPEQFLCNIVNTTGAPPEADGDFLKTSKRDSLRHGIGLRSIRQICDDLGGEMKYIYDENYFKIWVTIVPSGYTLN
ncbi:MAG: GHKL domain-containing protein [Defluviitaleaceae bacterium]|nr:GHKL domain-containing protein [Defluviitaleaceae bacterium]